MNINEFKEKLEELDEGITYVVQGNYSFILDEYNDPLIIIGLKDKVFEVTVTDVWKEYRTESGATLVNQILSIIKEYFSAIMGDVLLGAESRGIGWKTM